MSETDQQKTKDDALRESEARYRALVENASVWIWETDRNLRHVYTNPFVSACLGYQPDEFLAADIFTLVHPEDHGTVKELVHRAATERKGWRGVVLRWRHKDGTWRSIESSGTATFDADGNLLGLRGVDHDITDRKNAEVALRESEERFRTIFNGTLDGIALADATNGTFIMGNKNLYAMLGCTEDELRTMRVDDIHPADVMLRVRKHLEETTRGETSVVQDMPVKRRDGSVFYADISATSLLIDGRTHFIGVFRDVTERKMASEEQQKLASIIETSPDLIGIADLEGRLLYLNAAGQNLVGIDDIGDVRHKPVRQFFLEADYRMFETEIMPSVLQAGRWSGIVAYRHFKTGAPVPVEMKVFMIRDKKTDQPIALANISRDITERKRAEEALRESERSLKTLMSNLPGMAYRCRNDRNYTMEYVSEGTSALTGYLPKDLLGNAKIAFNDLIHPDDQGQVWDVVQKAIGQKEKYTLNYRIRKADGQERWVWEQGQGVFSETGDLLALEGFIIDVTERRLLEEERLKTQKIESIGTLAGGIAHDFNNLLQGIFGYISMAKITIDQREKALAMIDQAEKALHQTVSLTTQLLTFSKGGKPLMKNIRLIPVIENAVKFSLSGSRVDYDMDIDAGLWTVEGDEGQIGQVIQNLVINADQAMPMGGRIVIKARNMQAPGEQIPVALSAGNYVEISVQDSGIGIPNQYLESIFDPYFTTKEKGSGLGLAISYSIIRNHGGTIHVASEAGRGSTFSVYLPATAESPAAPASREVTGPTRKGRILLMDDEALVRAIATEMIKALGHEVECCTHGEECISKYLEARQQGTPFDVVILDLTIRGGMGGAEAVRRLLEIERQVKAVVSSGYADDSIIADYRSHGFSATLSKPYDIKALSNTLDALLAS